MSKNSLFSKKSELTKISEILQSLLRLPTTGDNISGDLMERVFAHVRGAKTLTTYDFVDVIDEEKKIGWQVKATKVNTPVTWIRAKIKNREQMIKNSLKSKKGVKLLGASIIDYCNQHIQKTAFDKYDINHIGFSRLIVHPCGNLTYYEKHLCSRSAPELFDLDDYSWQWSKPKKNQKKEQLPAFHGSKNGVKHWAWHGKGENQLHFSGEKHWWPTKNDAHSLKFNSPTEGKLSFEDLIKLL